MNQQRATVFELPRRLEKTLATLAVYYGQHDKELLQRLLVNSSYRVHEEWTSDNWNGGTYGHAVYFQVPAQIFFEAFDSLDEVGTELAQGINRISNVQNEYIEEVFLEIQDDPALDNWRENSGVLIPPSHSAFLASDDQLRRLWEPGYFRLFLTHKADYKTAASELKYTLGSFGVSCFVAHDDIEPTKEWQDEIERALFSMNALVALMTKGFSNSDWTDQEIGVAIGREAPIIPIRLGMDPYGFIGKYQGLPGTNKSPDALALDVYELLWANPSLKAKLTESLVMKFEAAEHYCDANKLMDFVAKIESASPEIIDRLEKALQGNRQILEAKKVKKMLPQVLSRLRGGGA